MKVLVIGPSWVGDMMMSQGLYRAIKARSPETTIDVMAPAWSQPLLNRMPEVHLALETPFSHGQLALGERRRLGISLQAQHYDQAIVLPGSAKSALIPFFAKIPQRTGWRGEMRYGLLNDLRILDKNAFPLMIERYIALAWPKGALRSARDLPQPLPWPQLTVRDEEIADTASTFNLTDQRPVIGFCPGAEFGPAKRWPDYHYAALARQLIGEGYHILLLGSANDRPVTAAIRQQLAEDEKPFCLDVAGQTSLDQAVVLLALCQAVVTNDSGLMHIAAALDRPLVALYGPSSPEFTPPLSHKARVIRLIDGYHKIRRGDGEQGYHQSLIAITPQRVMAELQPLLAECEESV